VALAITFLSDYGLADGDVGVVRGVIARLCPEARVIDLAGGSRAIAIAIGSGDAGSALGLRPGDEVRLEAA